MSNLRRFLAISCLLLCGIEAARAALGTPVLQSPPDGATGLGAHPTIKWSAVAGAHSYEVELANGRYTITHDCEKTTWKLPELVIGLTYHWRVRATAGETPGSWSARRSFTLARPSLPGKLVFVGDLPGCKSLFLINADGTGLRRLTYGEFDTTPVICTDGNKIAYQNDTNDICIINADGSEARCLTRHDGRRHSCPLFSPDGRHLAFYTDPPPLQHSVQRDRNISIMNFDGSDWRQLKTGGDPECLCFSPDGRYLAFLQHDQESDEKEAIAAFVMPVEGGQPTRVAGGVVREDGICFNPDSTQVAFTCANSKLDKQWVTCVNLDGSHAIAASTTPTGEDRSSWKTPDGHPVYLLRTKSEDDVRLYAVPLATGLPNCWLTGQERDAWDIEYCASMLSVSPDGRFVAIVLRNAEDNGSDREFIDLRVRAVNGSVQYRITALDDLVHNDFAWGPGRVPPPAVRKKP